MKFKNKDLLITVDKTLNIPCCFEIDGGAEKALHEEFLQDCIKSSYEQASRNY